MRQFAYERPSDLAAVTALLAEHGPVARVLAGGTDLLIRLRDRAIDQVVVVDVKRVPEIAPSISETDIGVRISAGTTMTHLVESPLIQRSYPALVEAAAIVGSVQIRNRATLAGNQCNASPAADTAPPLLVYGAVLTIAGPGGTRQLSLDEFFVRSGVTRLDRGELVTAITLPWPGPGRVGSAFGRRTRRRGHDLASVTLAVAIDEGGRTRLAFGSMGPRPLLFESHGGDLPLDEWLAHAAPSPTSMRASPEYRRAMVRVLAARALVAARQRLAAA